MPILYLALSLAFVVAFFWVLGKLVEFWQKRVRKTAKRSVYLLIAMSVIGIIAYSYITSSNPTKPLSPEEKAKVEYQKWVESQFSAWDGSNKYLVELVKENMNDPKSFEHIETKYKDTSDGLDLYMKFRGKNAFGGLVINEVNAHADYKTKYINRTYAETL